MPATEPSTPTMRLEREDKIAWIVIDNAAHRNALTSAMWDALPKLVAQAESDDEIRVLVLRGAGNLAFSAGADITEFETHRTGHSAKHYDVLNHVAFTTLSGCSKPTISMIHGFCLGGGLGLALSTDIRVADESSQFAIPAAKLGLGYNARWVRPLLAAVPPSRAKQLLFTGRRFAVEEAAQMGLVDNVVPTPQLETTVRALAGEIAANAPLTIRAAKLVIDELVQHPEQPNMAKLDELILACFESEDYEEGRKAFLEKRKPSFKGR